MAPVEETLALEPTEVQAVSKLFAGLTDAARVYTIQFPSGAIFDVAFRPGPIVEAHVFDSDGYPATEKMSAPTLPHRFEFEYKGQPHVAIIDALDSQLCYT